MLGSIAASVGGGSSRCLRTTCNRIVGEERLPAGEHLEQHHAARVEIGARVDVAAFALLGRHVVRRADDDAGRQLRRALGEAREPEVEDA